MLLLSFHFGMAADLPSRCFVFMSVSICEHCNDFSAGRTRGKYREDPCSEMENVIKDILQNQDVWVLTGFSWFRKASFSGLACENGNRQVAKCRSRWTVASFLRSALLRAVVPGGSWWQQLLSGSLHRRLPHGFDARAVPLGVRLCLGCGDGRPKRFVSSLSRAPSAGVASYSLTEHRVWISSISHRTPMKDEPHPFNVIRSVASGYKHLCVLIDAHYLYKITNIYCNVAQFQPFQTKPALMCKIQ